ncbi:MAG: hypothetical protein JWL90_4574 [Chthoniobacteraceae bacterium]|nr:hypothetical protein [Chthoniobacteraceae bacterium]
MINKDDNTGGGPVGPTPMNAFIKNPSFAPIYYKQLKELIDGPFAKANFDALVDSVLTGVVPQVRIESIKTFQSKLPTNPADPRTGGRTAYIASLIPLTISVTSGPAVLSGYPHTTTATTPLTGTANAIDTRSVKVNGVAAAWTAWTASWSAPSVALLPGINKVLIQSFDDSNTELERFTYDIWYDDATVASAGGTLAADTIWTAAAGPYRLTSNLVVPAGRTLTIQPGTNVYCANGTSAYSITVNGTGKILATGTETKRIVFTRAPGSTVNWTSLDFINTTAESKLSYVSFEYCGGSTIGGHEAQIHSNNAIVFFDHFTFPPTPAIEYMSFDAASFIVQNSIFPTYPEGTAQESLHGINGIMAGGHGVFRDNYFGHTWGFNDTIDFTGGQRLGTGAGPILQVINNVFDGATDDCLDLDSADAWIEGNVFMHVHRDPNRTDDARDTGSAISGGVDFANQLPDWTVINNLFYDVDHVFLNKGKTTTAPGDGGGRVAFLYNTVAHVAREGSGSPLSDIAAFIWSDDGVALPAASLGSGLYAAHNIIYDCAVLHKFYDPANHTVIMDNNILSVPWTGAGSGNKVIDPRLNLGVLNGTAVANVTADQLRKAYQLLPGSPALGAGFGGRNIGGLGAHGIAIDGEPIGTTNATTATLTIGPGGTFNWGTITAQPWGWTAYKWKLDNGAYSEEIPITNNSPFTALPTISLTGLANGTHTVSVIGKSDAGFYQDDTLIYPLTSGTPGAATVSRTWTVNTAYVPPAAQPNVRINEVLAKNSETQGFSGVFPDMIELYNAGGATATLTGWGLTDNTTIPYKYTFPATTLAPGAYLIVYAESSSSVPQPRTGFSLKQSGDTLTLTKSAAQGGGVQDSVSFGNQLSDYSSGRRSDGVWDLCVPTFGSPNVVAAQGSPKALKINEWLTEARTLFADDFIELFNPSSLPVNIGGGFLTDNPVEWITRHQIRQLTFLPPGGFSVFKADGNTDSGADHLSFKLSPTEGEIGLFTADQQLIDSIVYGSQSTDVSQGRSPNGSAVIVTFNQPTPGAGNPGGAVTGGTTTTSVNVIPVTQSWKYYPGATAAPPLDAQNRAFSDTAYIDTAWSTGAQLLYIEDSALTNVEGFSKTNGTLLTGYTATRPYQTYYFRTHFTYSGSLANLTLAAKIMVDDGCIVYLNGQEIVPITGARIGMAAGAFTYATQANRTNEAVIETFTFPADQLIVGDNVIAVEVHQANTQTLTSGSSDIVWGMKLDAETTISAAAATPVVINEVLARNITANPDGSTSGWIELYNSATTSYDLSDMSLTDEVDMPRKWVFPAGSTIPADGYLAVYCNSLLPGSTTNVPAPNTGFGLNGSGDAVYLFKKIADGGNLHDSVVYGLQVPNFSVGRVPNGTGPFVLSQPTRGALNDILHIAGTASITGSVKLNEWMSNPAPLPGPVPQPGWFELYNSAALPVLLSGNYLTDNLTAGNRTKYLIPPLTYIGSGPNAWATLIADNAIGNSGHVNFTLDKGGESLAIYSGNQVQIDVITYTPQYPGVSAGRFADGTNTILSFFGTPTPGAMNVFSSDSDNDGLPSEWEAAHGLDWNNPADADQDADSDSQSNLTEYNAGTDPFSSASKYTLSLSGQATGQTHIQFVAQPNKGYSVQYKSALTDAFWTKLSDVPAQSAARAVDVPDNTAGISRRFYRVVTPQQP